MPSLLTPLDIHEGQIGDWQVVKKTAPAGTVFSTANMRCRIIGGQKNRQVSWDHATTWHYLLEGGAVWMTDLPCEHAQMLAGIRPLQGVVLVGGLGLGLVATLLLRKKSVRKVVVVEKEISVINLVVPHLERAWSKRLRSWKMEIVCADLFDHLRQAPEGAYDGGFYDIWRGDGESTFFHTVCPLYDLSRGKLKTPPTNWNEDIMRGQLFTSALFRLHSVLHPAVLGGRAVRSPWEEDGTQEPWHNWSVPLFAFLRDRLDDGEVCQQAIGVYTTIYGTWGWERKWELYKESVS